MLPRHYAELSRDYTFFPLTYTGILCGSDGNR